MAPVSRGGRWSPLLPLLLLLLALVPAGTAAANLTPKTRTLPVTDSANEIEAFVKKLEYEAVNGVEYTVDGVVVPVDLNLLPDDIIAEDIQDGLEEEFSVVDKQLGDNSTETANATASGPQSRQLSLIFQGVYAPDNRFNAFVDGVMVNMIAEMRRKMMDPLYFRVYDRGIVEHVSTRGRGSRRDDSAVTATNGTNSSRKARQRGSPIGGGVIRGLTNVKRFGNAEVQIAGNKTLVRSHYVYGPLNVELVFNTDNGVKTINSTLTALAAHAVAEVNDNSSKLIDFIIDSPAEYEVRLVGARSERYHRISKSALLRLFKPTGRLERRLRGVYVRARSRRIPDVVARNERRNRRNRNRNRNRNKQAPSATNNEDPSRNGESNGRGNSERSNNQGGTKSENAQETELP